MTFSADRYQIPLPAVYIRSSWAEAWTFVPYLYADTVQHSIGGAFGQASLSYEYGRIQRPDSLAMATAAALSVARQYVKIVYTPNSPGGAAAMAWYGVIVASENETSGTNAGVPAGNQRFNVLSIDWLLTRRQIDSAHVEDRQSRGAIQIGRPIDWNSAEGSPRSGPDRLRANRSSLPYDDNGTLVYIFSGGANDAVLWDLYSILFYVFHFFQPHDGTGPDFVFDTSNDSYLGAFVPTVIANGRTVWDVLNATVNHRRGLTWRINPLQSPTSTAAGGDIQIVVDSYATAQITLPSGGTVASASSQQAIDDVSSEGQIQRSVVVTDTQEKYSQVKVIGARRGACFTVSYDDQTLEPEWTGAEQTAYGAGDPDVTGLDLDRTKAAHDAWRTRDDMRHVFTRFKLPDDWDGRNGQGFLVCPYVDPYTGDVVETRTEFWREGLRFLDRLPLLEFVDYSNGIDDSFDANANAPSYRRPFAAVKIGNTDYCLGDQLAAYSRSETTETSGVEGSVRVKGVDNAPSLFISPTMPHHAALGEFGTVGPTGDTTDIAAFFSWRFTYATVFAEFDEYATAIYPASPEPAQNDSTHPLIIRLGDRARMDYVPIRTVVDVKNRQTVWAQQGGFVRNDHPMMRDVARMAWEWYRTARYALRLSVANISSNVAIGTLITTYDGTAVNSVVSSITHDFVGGNTAISTHFADIDARRLIG